MLQLGRAFLGSLYERIGSRDGYDASVSSASVADPLFWARVFGENGKQSGNGITGSGPTFDYTLAAVQVGTHLYRNGATGTSHDDAGVFGSFGHVWSNVIHDDLLAGRIHAGNNNMDAVSLAAYWTHYGSDGSYLDGVVQGIWFDSARDRSSENVASLSARAKGYGASLESGWRRFTLSPDLTLQPQAQVIYQRLSINSASNDFETVQFDNIGSLAARIGAQLANTADGKDTLGGLNGWLALNAWHEFHASPRTTYPTDDGDVSFHSDLQGTWWELKFGAQGQVSQHVNMYGTLSYDSGGIARHQEVGVNLGIMVHW